MKPLEIYSLIMRIFIFTFGFMVIFQTGAFYGGYAEPGQGVYDFFSKDYKVYRTPGGELPSDTIQQIDDYNAIMPYIWFTIIAIFLYSIPGIAKTYLKKIKKIRLVED